LEEIDARRQALKTREEEMSVRKAKDEEEVKFEAAFADLEKRREEEETQLARERAVRLSE